jgi:ATP-dependent protease HslVU (ClpYQ) peptidase subunit
MTCVIALKLGNGRVLMGADSAGVAGHSLMTRVDPKIYKVGKMLIGFTTSFRMGQLLRYGLTPPKHHDDVPIERYMATEFVDAVRTCLKSGGYAKKENEVEQAGTFLVAYRGRIFQIESDYQVGEANDPFAAVGCGSDIALGSLYTSSAVTHDPMERVTAALDAAARFSAGVRGPFVFEELAE